MVIKRLRATIRHLVLCGSCRHWSEGGTDIALIDASPRVPVEICELIIDMVAAFVGGWMPRTYDPWWRTLVACALTCRVWYARAQYHRLKIVDLRDRKDVALLYNRLRDAPQLKVTVQEVNITGSYTYTDDRLPLSHLGMFITKLALQLPNLNRIGIYGMLWTFDSVRQGDLQYLQVFRSITRLDLVKVTFTNASQLARLLAALPMLVVLFAVDILCLQGQNVSPTSLYFRRSMLLGGQLHLYDPLAPPVVNLLTHVTTNARIFSLRLTIRLCPSLVDTETEGKLGLLRATAMSVRALTLELDTSETTPSVIDNIGDVLDLSQHTRLESFRIDLIPPSSGTDASYSWLAPVLNALGSDITLRQFSLVFDVSHDPGDIRVTALLSRLAHHHDLNLLDQTLTRLFYNIDPEKLILGVRLPPDADHERWGLSNNNMDRICWDRWEHMVREKMPRANKRGILSTVVYIGNS